MAFFSTYVNKVDRKGRVSVPAVFRNELLTPQGVVLFRSFKFPALEAFDYEQMTVMMGQLEQFDLFSDEREHFSSLFSDSVPLAFDPEGRITLPDHLREFANIAEEAAFVGVGTHFQLWEPSAEKKKTEAAREKLRSGNLTLPMPARRMTPAATA